MKKFNYFTSVLILLGLIIACGQSSKKDSATENKKNEKTTQQSSSDNNDNTIKNTEKEPPKEKPKTEEVISVSVDKLYEDYEANEIKADNMYKGKRLKIRGTIDGLGKDIFDNIYITIKTKGGFLSSIHCTINDSYNAEASNLSKGQQVTVIGECTGSSMGSPCLTDCSIK